MLWDDVLRSKASVLAEYYGGRDVDNYISDKERVAIIEMTSSDMVWDERFQAEAIDIGERLGVIDPLYNQKVTSLHYVYNMMSFADKGVEAKMKGLPTPYTSPHHINVAVAAAEGGLLWTGGFLHDLNYVSGNPLSENFMNDITNLSIKIQIKLMREYMKIPSKTGGHYEGRTSNSEPWKKWTTPINRDQFIIAEFDNLAIFAVSMAAPLASPEGAISLATGELGTIEGATMISTIFGYCPEYILSLKANADAIRINSYDYLPPETRGIGLGMVISDIPWYYAWFYKVPEILGISKEHPIESKIYFAIMKNFMSSLQSFYDEKYMVEG